MTRQVVLFAAATAATGAELWITDGTPGGTRLLKDLMPGEGDSAPSDFTDLGNGKTLFVATGEGGGNTLWVTDGTPTGTVPLDLPGRIPGVDMMPTRFDTAKQMLALGDGRAVFTGSIGETSGVWVTDGTASHTRLLLEADVGTYGGPSGYTSLGGGRVLFNAFHEAYGEELWVTDGTPDGTVRLADLASGEASSTPDYVTPIGNGRALFVAWDENFHRNLYITNGTQAGTTLFKPDVDEALVSLGDGRVLFTTTASGLTTPWLTDGTAVGTKRILDVDLHGVASPSITLDGGETLFVGTASGEADSLWITDGSFSGTFGLNLHLPEAYLVSFAALGAGRVLAAVDDTAGTPGSARVWVSDGTLGGTHVLRQFASFYEEVLTPVGDGRVVFAVQEDADGPVVPWVTDGTVTGTMSLSGAGAGTGVSAPTGFAAAAFADLPVVSITGQASKEEGDAGTTPFTLTLTRTGDLGAPLSVTYTLRSAEKAGGRPAVAADFAGGVLPSGTATFAAGSATATVTLPVAGDTEYGPDKLFTLALSSPEDGLSVTLDPRVVGTIRNDDTGISIQADAAERDEGNAGATTAFTFTVTRHGDTGEALTIPYTVSGAGVNPASAAQFKDGKYPSGSVAFAIGATQGKITVQVRGDSVFEPDMAFAVALSGPAAPVTFLPQSATATIRNDDAPPVLRITATDADKTEAVGADTPFRFTVTRTGDMVGEFRVGYVVTGTGNTPATAADFASGTRLSDTILFPSGSATPYDLYLFGTDNSVHQPDRTFTVTLLPTIHAQIASGTASGIIRDDDAALPPPGAGGTEIDAASGSGGTDGGGGTGGGTHGGTSTVSVTPLDASKAEGDTGTTAFTFALTRTGDLSAAGGVAYRVIGAGANPAAAYQFAGGAYPSGTVVFAPGQASQSLTVQVAGNPWDDPNAAFQVVLDAPTGNALLGTATASGIILNDDFYRTVPSGGTVQDAGGDQRYVGTGAADVVRFASGARGVSVSLAPNGDVYLGRAGQTDVLRGIEAVRFTDGRLVFDPADPAAQVARLYRAGLGRSADQGGLGYWTESIQDGASLTQLAASFLDSPEFTSRFGHSLGDAEFVQRLYQNVLGRAPDPGGQAYWTGVLARGADRAAVLSAISESAENRQTTAALVQAGLWQLDPAAAQAARMYDTVFGRLPDAGGLGYWADALGAGALGLQDMANGFVASPEFQAVYGTLSDREFVAEIYANTLRRPGDAGGIEYWTARLNEGATRAGLVVGFSESAEHRDLTASNIMGDTPGRYGIVTS